MARHRAASRSSTRRTTRPERPAARPPVVWRALPIRHPALWLAVLAAAASLVLSVSFAIIDSDVWQHLLVGRAIWTLHRVPTTQLWTWPTYGAPDVNPSWGFSALIWPVWSSAGVWGLFAWRWLSTLAVFGIAWAIARRLGARGVAPLVVIALAALVYRQRSQVRPETLAAILLAVALWILEHRRTPGARDHAPWLVAIAWIWANAHISYWIGLALIGIHVIAGLVAGARAGFERPPPRPLWLAGIGVAAAAVSFLNPFGWHSLAQPFEYFLFWRHEPIYRSIGELWPVHWEGQRTSGLPLLAIGWPLLWLWRMRRGSVDLVELLALVSFTLLGFSTQRFLGVYAVIAAPYVARGVSEWLGARRWAVFAAPWARAGTAAILCLTIGIPEWSRPELPLGVRFDPLEVPGRACDAMVRDGVRGRGYTLGGYFVYRFWPDRTRLPFIDIHQTGTPEIRRLDIEAFERADGWPALDRRFRFDYVVASRRPFGNDVLLDALDRDTSFATVFVDDVAALLVRRHGPYAALAEQKGYRLVPIGPTTRRLLRQACTTDSVLRVQVVRELERESAESPWCASAHDLWGELEAFSNRLESARDQFASAAAADPLMIGPHERLGVAELLLGHPDRALRAFERECVLRGSGRGLDLRFGQAYRGLGRLGAARAAYRREISRGEWKAEAAESLSALERIGG